MSVSTWGEELRREWRRLHSVDAKVVELRRSCDRRGRARWHAIVESALERRASASAVTPGRAIRVARRKLGYRATGSIAALASEIPVQATLS